jgi:hypothetical protein
MKHAILAARISESRGAAFFTAKTNMTEAR